MTQNPSTYEEKVRSFWDRYVQNLHESGIQPPSDRWMVIRAEHDIAAYPDRKLAEQSPEDVDAYLAELGRNPRLKDWQYILAADHREHPMPHDINLISTIATAFGLALVCGFLAARLRLPPLVGYLVAGILIGPATPGFVGDLHLSGQLAEIGVMLLMFGVGLHFSLEELWGVRRIALPGAVVQIAVAPCLP